jgi:hypothetical protein
MISASGADSFRQNTLPDDRGDAAFRSAMIGTRKRPPKMPLEDWAALSYSKVTSFEDGQMKKRTFMGWVFLLLLVGVIPASLFAQAKDWKDVKVEFSTGISWEFLPLSSSYLHKYSPPFFSGAYVSTAQQTINLKGKANWGVNAALTYYPVEHLGIQFQVEFGRPRLKGKNTNYDVYLNYTLSSPAGSPPYPYVFERSYGWPSTEGTVDELCFSLNAVVRLPLSKRITLNFSGGPTYFRVKSEQVGLAYSRYWMEDAYFNGETFQLKFKLGYLNRLGANLGGEFNWLIFRTVAFVADFRFYSTSEVKLPIRLLPNEMLNQPLAETAATMELGKIGFNPSFYRINLGLKYLF